MKRCRLKTDPYGEVSKGGAGKVSPLLTETEGLIGKRPVKRADRSFMDQNKSNKIQTYRDSVFILSYDLALLSLMAERAEQNKLTDVKYTESALAKVKTDRRRFVDARAALGLDTGQEALAAFTENHLFDGFSLQGGRFEGDRKSAGKVCGEWIGDMAVSPTEEEATRFEYGCYILMLSGGAQMVFSQTAVGQEVCKRPGWLYGLVVKQLSILKSWIRNRKSVSRHRNAEIKRKGRGSFNEKT